MVGGGPCSGVVWITCPNLSQVCWVRLNCGFETVNLFSWPRGTTGTGITFEPNLHLNTPIESQSCLNLTSGKGRLLIVYLMALMRKL